MPKKFSVENTKAVAAKARKAAAREQEKAQKQKEIEDAYWREDDKLILKKQQRKDEKERKKQEQMDKKAENKALMEEELKNLKLSKQNSVKVTQSQINAEMEKKRLAAAKLVKKVDTHLDQPLEENINHMSFDTEVATTITEAIAVLSDKEAATDKHPERRLKAAYAAFEEANMARVKEENPTLRLSQIKQLIWKEWMKSSENPLNQRDA